MNLHPAPKRPGAASCTPTAVPQARDLAVNLTCALSLRFSFLVVVVGALFAVQAPASAIQISGVTAHGWPNERGSDHEPFYAVDGSQATFTWTTEAYNTLEANLGLDFGRSERVNRIRLFKEADGCGWGGGCQWAKDLIVLYTQDSGPMSARTWIPVINMTNGFLGAELLRAQSVNLTGTVDNDLHNSISEGHGWASLSFDSVSATGVCVRFQNDDPNWVFVHYKVYEFEAWDSPVLTSSTLVAGQAGTLTVSRLEPGDEVAFAYSRSGAGPTTVSTGRCGVRVVALTNPVFISNAVAGSDGTASLSRSLPLILSGRTIWFHALNLTTCTLTNPLVQVVQ